MTLFLKEQLQVSGFMLQGNLIIGTPVTCNL
jgi:hypothetical protein